MRIPFWARLWALFSMVLLLVALLLGWIQYRTQRKVILQEYRRETETIVGTLTPVFLDPLLRGYILHPDNELTAISLMAKNNPDILRLRVQRDDGEPLLPDLPGLDTALPATRDGHLAGGVLRLVRPITIDYAEGQSRPIGWIELVFSTQRLDEALRSLVRQGVHIAAVFLFLGFAASLLISRLVTVPLGKLADGMRRLREGDLDVHVPVESRDEIGDLAQTFNETVEDLRAKKELLHYVSQSAWEAAHRRAAGDAEATASTQTLTILFSDIQGFTPFTEKSAAAEVVTALNQYFDRMVEVVLDQGGSVDKFVGDALMAIFKGEDGGANAAVATARRMQARLVILRERAATSFHIRIGVNTGDVILGDIGSQKARRDSTCIGDPVNVAARLCYTCSDDGIHVGSETYRRLIDPPPAALRTGLRVKGIERDLETYTIS